jgi:Flp pilus assembly pilin Flp
MSYYQGQMYRFQYIQLRKNYSRAIAIYTIMQPNMTDFQEHIGAIAIEYGQLISVVIIGAVTAVGTQLIRSLPQSAPHSPAPLSDRR